MFSVCKDFNFFCTKMNFSYSSTSHDLCELSPVFLCYPAAASHPRTSPFLTLALLQTLSTLPRTSGLYVPWDMGGNFLSTAPGHAHWGVELFVTLSEGLLQRSHGSQQPQWWGPRPRAEPSPPPSLSVILGHSLGPLPKQTSCMPTLVSGPALGETWAKAV